MKLSRMALWFLQFHLGGYQNVILYTIKMAPRMACANCRCGRPSAFRVPSGEMVMDVTPREITLLLTGFILPTDTVLREWNNNYNY